MYVVLGWLVVSCANLAGIAESTGARYSPSTGGRAADVQSMACTPALVHAGGRGCQGAVPVGLGGQDPGVQLHRHRPMPASQRHNVRERARV